MSAYNLSLLIQIATTVITQMLKYNMGSDYNYPLVVCNHENWTNVGMWGSFTMVATKLENDLHWVYTCS